MVVAALSTRDLSVRHRPRSAPVICELSLTLLTGSITVLLGPNASGKSSLLLGLTGLLPYEGQIQVQGQDLASMSRGERARALAYLPQHSQLQSPLRVREVIAMGQILQSDKAGPAKVQAAIEQVRAEELAERNYMELSGGQKQRVLLARALATGARILLLDEPTSALDLLYSLQLVELLQSLASDGYTILWALHDLNLAKHCASACVLLDQGRVHAQGDPATVLSKPNIRAVYGVELLPDRGFDYAIWQKGGA